MKDRAAKSLRARIDQAVEAEVHPGHKDMELRLLATLATVIQSDQSELKYDLLDLVPDDFHFADHRAIFAAMKALADTGDHVDEATVRARIGDAWPDALKAVFDKANADIQAADTYKRRIIFWSNIFQAEQLGHAYLNAVEAAANADSADLAGLVADLQKTVFDIKRTGRLSPPPKSEADLTDNFLLDLANPTPGYRTGFDKLEKIIRGLTPGLFVIAAPPSAGKTTYVKQLADQVADLNHVPVLFFSYEQSADELRIKSLARLSRVTNEDIKAGLKGVNVQAAVEAAATTYKGFGQWIKVIEGDRQHTIGRIRLLAQRERMQTARAPVIIIDYLQVLPVNDPALKDKRAEVDFLVSELRRIARDIGTPIIAVSSMSRAEYDKVTMSGFKESGGIEYGTDIAAILKVEDEDRNSGTKRTVTLNIIKNRNGRRGKVGMNYDMAHDSFEESDSEHLSYMDTLGKDKSYED